MNEINGLSVVIVNWRNVERTLRCVAFVQSWCDLRAQVFVVDNESTEVSRTALGAALGQAELVISETNLGYAGGNNLGIGRALADKTPFILLLNSDAEIVEQNVVRLLDRLRENPAIAIIGPVLHEKLAGGVCSIGGKDILRNALTRQTSDPDALRHMLGYPLHDVDYVPGTVFLARRSVFEEIGLLDEQFFFSGEIADLCKRARDAGHRVCIDLEAEARHDKSAASQPLRDTLYVYYSLRNRALYAKKHGRLDTTKHLVRWSRLCLTELGKSLMTGRLGKSRAIMLALAHGYANRFGNQNAAFLR